MAKRKHPTAKSLKQGQTIYQVVDDSFMMDRKVPKRVVKHFMYSHKTLLPPIGTIIEKMPVNSIQGFAKRNGFRMKNWYYSKKLAESAAKI